MKDAIKLILEILKIWGVKYTPGEMNDYGILEAAKLTGPNGEPLQQNRNRDIEAFLKNYLQPHAPVGLEDGVIDYLDILYDELTVRLKLKLPRHDEIMRVAKDKFKALLGPGQYRNLTNPEAGLYRSVAGLILNASSDAPVFSSGDTSVRISGVLAKIIGPNSLEGYKTEKAYREAKQAQRNKRAQHSLERAIKEYVRKNPSKSQAYATGIDPKNFASIRISVNNKTGEKQVTRMTPVSKVPPNKLKPGLYYTEE